MEVNNQNRYTHSQSLKLFYFCSIGPGAHHFKMTRFGSLLLVPADMDIVDQTKIFTKLDPYHQQFIPTPSVNAGEILI